MGDPRDNLDRVQTDLVYNYVHSHFSYDITITNGFLCYVAVTGASNWLIVVVWI